MHSFQPSIYLDSLYLFYLNYKYAGPIFMFVEVTLQDLYYRNFIIRLNE